MTRRRVLMSAYACDPSAGGEAGVGWNIAAGMASYHDVWVITRPRFRAAIESQLNRDPIAGFHVIYYNLPEWMNWWRRGQLRRKFSYYFWQIGLYSAVKRLHREVGFDLSHHISHAKYWAPSGVSMLDVPFVWGPIGGGESAPRIFRQSLAIGGWLYEFLRDVGRWLGEHDPLVRATARRSTHALATTTETAERLVHLKVKNISILSASALSDPDVAFLDELPPAGNGPFTFISIGRLVELKGFHVGLQAFARAQIANSRYIIVGNGPEAARLDALATQLGISSRVTLTGRLPRRRVLELLGECHVLVHPSLHDSSGWVCAEAMAAGRPVICLDLGGPATQVTSATGLKIKAQDPEAATEALANAMKTMAGDPSLVERMGQAGKMHVRDNLRWSVKTAALADIYRGLQDVPDPSLESAAALA